MLKTFYSFLIFPTGEKGWEKQLGLTTNPVSIPNLLKTKNRHPIMVPIVFAIRSIMSDDRLGRKACNISMSKLIPKPAATAKKTTTTDPQPLYLKYPARRKPMGIKPATLTRISLKFCRRPRHSVEGFSRTALLYGLKCPGIIRSAGIPSPESFTIPPSQATKS